MNRIYKVIYSKARQCSIVVSEFAKSRHKNSRKGASHTGTPALARILAAALVVGAVTWGGVPEVSWAADNTAVTDSNGNAVTNTDKKITDINANITGKGNKVIDSSNAEIVGDSNTVTNEAKGEDNSVRHVRSDDARIHGSGNTISASRNQQVIGDNNTIMGRDDGTVTDYQHPEGREPNVSDLTIGRGNFIRSTDTYRNEWDSLKVIGNNNRADFKVESAGGPAAGIVIGDNQNIDGIKDSIVIGSLSPDEQKEQVGEDGYKSDKYTVGLNSVVVGYHATSSKGASTVIGNRSKVSGNYQTVTGLRSTIEGNYYNSFNLLDGQSGNFASIYGSFNKIEDATGPDDMDGVGNSINGSMNVTSNARGTMIMGVGNTVTHSKGEFLFPKDDDSGISTGDWLYVGAFTANDYAQGRDITGDNLTYPADQVYAYMRDAWQRYMETSGGAVSVLGNSNTSDYVIRSQILGTNNMLKGSEDNISSYNTISGFSNTGTNVKRTAIVGTGNNLTNGVDNVVIGDYHTLENGKHNVILGSMASEEKAVTKTAKAAWAAPDDNSDGTYTYTVNEQVALKPNTKDIENAVMVGYNTDVTQNGGVALGSDSVASTKAGIAGFDPQSRKHVNSEKDYSTWVSTDAAVSVGGADREVKYKDKEGKEQVQIVKSTRQITNVAAGKEDTDAVNVAQLKAISSTMNTDIAASKTHFYSVKSTDAKAKNYNNDGATAANALAAGVGANADKASAVAIGDTAYAGSANGVAIGTGSWIRSSDGKPNANGGDVAIGQDSHVDSYVNQGGSIALGQNARVENMYGNTEKSWAFGQTEFDDKNIPLNPGNEAGGVAIGRNSFARTGSLMVGSHMYKGAIADIDEVDGTDSQKLRDNFNNVNMTTLGTNSFNNGTFATVTGSYSATTAKKKIQNFAATVDGSLNSIESYKDAADNSGVASSIVGTANRIANSNNTTIIGAGNEVTNSLTDIEAPTEGGASAKALQGTLKGNLQKDTKGAVVVSGIGNKVNSSHGVSVLGSRNVVNTTDNIQLLGDNREVTGATGSVIIGSADSKTTTSVTDATILGHNANVEKAGGVALGAGSVASREAGVAGYDPATKADSTDSSATWKATDAAVSVGKENGSMTRQITGVAAGSKATDAVNVAQLQKALAGAKDGNDTLKSGTDALKLDGNKLSMNIQDTAGNTVSGSVDLSKFAQAVDTNTTYTLTGQENKDNNTTTITLEDNNGNKNNVTVATKDTRNTVKAGENVTLGITNNTDGSHEYTVNVKADGKVEAGSTKIVSGDTVYNETRVKQDGTYVKVSNTAGENLSALDNQVTSNTQNINYLNGRVGELGDRINKVGAGAAALAALHPLDYDPEDKWDFAVGVGNYRNATAAAVGLFYRPNERTMFNLGWTMGDNRNMVNGGFSLKFGKSNKYIKYSKAEMASVIDKQSMEIAELKARDVQNAKDKAEMKAEIEALKKQVEALAAKK